MFLIVYIQSVNKIILHHTFSLGHFRHYTRNTRWCGQMEICPENFIFFVPCILLQWLQQPTVTVITTANVTVITTANCYSHYSSQLLQSLQQPTVTVITAASCYSHYNSQLLQSLQQPTVTVITTANCYSHYNSQLLQSLQQPTHALNKIHS
jgi:hypothetical protein